MSRFALRQGRQFIYDLDGIVTDTEEERQFALCFPTQEEAYAAALEWCSDLEVVDLDMLGVPIPTEAAKRKYHDKVWGGKMPFWMDVDDMIQRARERLGYEPGHKADCPERMVDFCIAKCSCGPDETTHSESETP